MTNSPLLVEHSHHLSEEQEEEEEEERLLSSSMKLEASGRAQIKDERPMLGPEQRKPTFTKTHTSLLPRQLDPDLSPFSQTVKPNWIKGGRNLTLWNDLEIRGCAARDFHVCWERMSHALKTVIKSTSTIIHL